MSDDDVVTITTGLDEQEQNRITAEKPESLPRRIVEGPVLTPLGQYVPIEWDGANTSGLKPMGDSILILPDQPRPRTAGGIFLSDQEIERMAYAAETGVIVEVGDGAWAWNADRTRKFEGERPKPGTRVWFERYAGALPHGKDGLIYRLVTDKQIGAIDIGLPDTHEFAEVDGKRAVRRKAEQPEPSAPPAGGDPQEAEAVANSWLAEVVEERFAGVVGDASATTAKGEPYVVLAIGGVKAEGNELAPAGYCETPKEAAEAWIAELEKYIASRAGGGAYEIIWRRQPVVHWAFDVDKWQATGRLFVRVPAPIKMVHANVKDGPLAEAPKAKLKQAPVEPPPWPRYLKRDGNMMMAYDQADADAKAPGALWLVSRELAEMRGT